MLRLSRPPLVSQSVGSAAIARARLAHALEADRAHHEGRGLRERGTLSAGHADDILSSLLGESLPVTGRNQ